MGDRDAIANWLALAAEEAAKLTPEECAWAERVGRRMAEFDLAGGVYGVMGRALAAPDPDDDEDSPEDDEPDDEPDEDRMEFPGREE